MIIGLGTDLCDIARVENTLKRFPGRFENRLYTEQEQARAERRPHNRAGRYAQMFAAKEACSKALGTGFRQGVFWRDMEVVHLRSGKPTLELRGGALARMQKLTPDGMRAQVELSLTDESGLANAVVIIFAVPA
ncbi:MAG: holo-ACP synthase [Rhodospirillaceae bacterium]|jgi:holo-[acyl-carrier protein] synthase|nr:holo-ACP synthase [Rhodospirillaceae bacterium]MDD9915007.1 holo-ACP synthase [Rhodospirillaceae bacterium]MDD9929732.1 holo-ACP synthase [Rhodospirillaceae bacterium]